MIKYAQIINEEIGTVAIGEGDDSAFYESLGFSLMDVAQSDIDGAWYLTEKCPMKTDEQKAQEEYERIKRLSCTKRDFALMLQELGVDYLQL